MTLSSVPRRNDHPRQGDIYEWGGSGRYMIVLSDDDHNAYLDPLCAPVVRTAPPGPYVVELVDADPIGGRIIANLLVPVPRVELRKHAGMLTGDTWRRCTHALALLFGISS